MADKNKIRIWHEGPSIVEPLMAEGGGSVVVEGVPVKPVGMRAYTTFVIPEFCSDCIYCEGSCPNLRFDKTNRIMVVNTVACRGCGSCLAACPTGALQQRNSYLGTIMAGVADLLGQGDQGTPKSCNLCPVVSGELGEGDGDGHDIRLLCSGRFETALALEAMSRGYKGVVVVGCLFKDFPFERNREAMRERLEFTRAIFELMGLDPKRVAVLDGTATYGGVMGCIRQLLGE